MEMRAGQPPRNMTDPIKRGKNELMLSENTHLIRMQVIDNQLGN